MRDDPGFQPPMDITAEASSDAARGPSYEDLWQEPRRSRPAPARRRPDRLPVIAAIGAVLFGSMALIGMREKIVRAFPPLASAYSAVGLGVNLAGLELRDLHSRIVLDGPRKILTIEGEIVNVRREANAVPPVALTVRAEGGLARYAWTAPAPKARLEGGERIAFRARLASPPPDGADVLVRFAKVASRD